MDVWAVDTFGDAFDEWSGEIISTVLFFLAAVIGWWLFRWLGGKVVRGLVGRRDSDATGIDEAQRIQTLWRVLLTVVAIVLVTVVILTAMQIWGIPIGPLVAVGGVVGVAIGFGAQNFIKDVIAGFLIVAEHQYSIGDIVSIAGVSGEVETIRLRTTVLRDLDGNVHHVPNGAIVVASNYTQEYSQVVIDIGIAYDQDLDEAMVVIRGELERFASDPDWGSHLQEPPQMLGVNELGDHSVVVRALLRVDPAARWTARREFLHRIKNRLDLEGIEIPFQHLTVVMKDEAAVDGGEELSPPE